MQDPIGNFLARQPLMVLDGAMATELERRGADLDDPLWSAKCLLQSPELIRDVHLDYFRAGADVATTATYQATFAGFAQRGIDGAAAAALMREAVALAIAARDEFCATVPADSGRLRPLVAAAVGPYGAMLADGSEYRGHYALDDGGLADFHRPRMRVLADSGADLLACETIPCLREALVLAELLGEFPSLTAWISFSCADGERNCQGEDIGSCAAALRRYPQVAAVGVNCTAPQHITSLLQKMQRETRTPLLAYPNSGERYQAAAKQWSGERSATQFGECASDWYRHGARLIGGCCRTSPEDIQAVRRCVRPRA